MSDTAICWLNGKLMPAKEASIPVLDHGLLYGDGVFEGIRFYHGRPFRLEAHLERFIDSAKAIALALPWSQDEMAAAVNGTIEAFPGDKGYLRVVATRGVGPLGINPSTCSNPNFFVIADQLRMIDSAKLERGVRVVIAATRRLSPDGLDPRIKSLNYLNHILARIEANAAGADEALLLNAHGRIAEGSADNVFIVRRGELLTPPAIEGALEGITRNLVLELARAAGIPARETPLAPYDLYTADECFLTGTGAELIPVAEIAGRHMVSAPGRIFLQLKESFATKINKETF